MKITAAAVATAATAGIALVHGLMDIAATVAGLTVALVGMNMEAETMEMQLSKSIDAVVKKRPDSSKWNTFRASLETFARKIDPTRVLGAAVASEVQCKELNEQYGHKLEGLEVKARDGTGAKSSKRER